MMYSGDEYYDDDITSGPETCEECGDEVCKHGGCSCDGRGCINCEQRREREREADEEFAFQRDVIGPMFGFDQEGQ